MESGFILRSRSPQDNFGSTNKSIANENIRKECVFELSNDSVERHYCLLSVITGEALTAEMSPATRTNAVMFLFHPQIMIFTHNKNLSDLTKVLMLLVLGIFVSLHRHSSSRLWFIPVRVYIISHSHLIY